MISLPFGDGWKLEMHRQSYADDFGMVNMTLGESRIARRLAGGVYPVVEN